MREHSGVISASAQARPAGGLAKNATSIVIRVAQLLVAILASGMAFATANADANVSAPDSGQPSAYVGIYLNNIPSVSIKEKKFQVDFNIWFRWTDDRLNPIESFKIFNGTIDAKDGLVKKKIGNVNYAMQRVQATIYRNFDVARYPLDNHVLKIQIENSGGDEVSVAYLPDKANTQVSPKITVPGWAVGAFDSYASKTVYQTNYGDPSLSASTEAKIPRYTFSVELKRVGYGFFFKYFSVLFLAAAVTFIAFWLSPDQIDTRYWLITTGFFLAVITGSSLATTLPETESLGLGDKLYNLTMVFTLISAAVMIHHSKIHAINSDRANTLSRQWGWGLPLAYSLLTGVIVVFG